MVTVTRGEFDSLAEQVESLNTKMDSVLEIIRLIANEHDGDAKELSDFRKETRERFDQLDTKVEDLAVNVDELTAKVDALNQSHNSLRQEFKEHNEHSR